MSVFLAVPKILLSMQYFLTRSLLYQRVQLLHVILKQVEEYKFSC